jgi:hypothetical protein
MSFLKIAEKNVTIKTMGNMMDFFTSITTSNSNPKFFNIETKDGKKFKLTLSSIQKEDGSGKNFLFTAHGYAAHPNKEDTWVPIAGKVEGFIRF